MLRVRIDVNVSYDRGFELTGAGDDVLKVVDFEPEQYAVANRLRRIAKRTMMMIGMPIVQLQDQPITSPLARVVSRVPQPLIFSTTMTSNTAEQPLVPSARILNVSTENEWLCAHTAIMDQIRAVAHPRPSVCGRSTFKT